MILNGNLTLNSNLTFNAYVEPLPYKIQGNHYKCIMGDYAYHVFTGSSTFTVIDSSGIDCFIVGGGGGIKDKQQYTGGGGAGQVYFANDMWTFGEQSFEVTISIESDTVILNDSDPVLVVGAGGYGGNPDGGNGNSGIKSGCGGGGFRNMGLGYKNGGDGNSANASGGGGGYAKDGYEAKDKIGGDGGQGVNISDIWQQIIEGHIGELTVGAIESAGWFAGGGGGYGKFKGGSGGRGGGAPGSNDSDTPHSADPNTGGGAGGVSRTASIGSAGIMILRHLV